MAEGGDDGFDWYSYYLNLTSNFNDTGDYNFTFNFNDTFNFNGTYDFTFDPYTFAEYVEP